MGDNEQEIVKVEKNAQTDIVVKISEFQGRVGVDIREYQKAGGYIGPTSKGIRIPVEKWQELKAILDKVQV